MKLFFSRNLASSVKRIADLCFFIKTKTQKKKSRTEKTERNKFLINFCVVCNNSFSRGCCVYPTTYCKTSYVSIAMKNNNNDDDKRNSSSSRKRRDVNDEKLMLKFYWLFMRGSTDWTGRRAYNLLYVTYYQQQKSMSVHVHF